jgi:hypothetical protein
MAEIRQLHGTTNARQVLREAEPGRYGCAVLRHPSLQGAVMTTVNLPYSGVATIRWGSVDVPLYEGPWTAAADIVGFRELQKMKPGQLWFDLPFGTRFYEHLPLVNGRPVPVGVAIAGELIRSGAEWAYLVEVFGGHRVLLDFEARCVVPVPAAARALERLQSANDGRLGGFPDVIASLGGRLVLREAKVAGKDRLNDNQHRFADNIRRDLGMQAVDFAVVEWNRPVGR